MLEVEGTHSRDKFPIVGVGASAGGVEAFTLLLQSVPADLGVAFVLVQHLDRTHPSLLSAVLGKVTPMPVQQAEHGMLVEPNHVYVIAPNTDLALRAGCFVLTPRPSGGPESYLPVDFFFRSLAAELGSRAIGVVLSGNASDGTEGLRAIRAEDGFTFAQDPKTAKFPGMPQSAVDAGVVDHCLEITELAGELVRLSRHPYVHRRDSGHGQREDDVRDEIFAHIDSAVGIDFRQYKQPTVMRRLARRLALRKATDLRAYLTLLDAEPVEVRALAEDMLIHVTSFFRDPEVFEALTAKVFPEIVKSKPEGSTVRVWVAGCSTGEEVYSYAIALLEFLGHTAGRHAVQIFGTDVSEAAIQQARTGVYSESTMQDVSEERRKHFFQKVAGGYRINKAVRDLCIFVRHDLARDPPFSKLDIASCRNVLIYFDQALQHKVVPTLHYCLNQPGFLVLGRSENIAGLSRLFTVEDKANKIFKRTSAASTLRFSPRTDLGLPANRLPDRMREPQPQPSSVLAKHLDRLLLARYCPPGVLVDDRMEILLFRGPTGAYLQAAPGQPQANLISMARGGLVAVLRATIDEARLEGVVVTSPGVEVDQGGATKVCDVVVLPFTGLPEHKEPLFIVLFEEPNHSPAAPAATLKLLPGLEPGASAELRRIARLEHELSATKEYLHSMVEEHSRASDELGTSNEELTSGNEELQSMNEELETAKEELQSVNEELTTLNEELRSRNQEVSEVNTELVNFAVAIDTSILTLDMKRRIRRVTPRAGSVLNVKPSDLGRSIDDVKLSIDLPDLSLRIASVLQTRGLEESEVQDRTGHWYRLQLRPYTTPENGIDGVILSLVDIHELKQLVREAEEARAEAERANQAKDDFLATLSHELRTPLSSMLLNAQRLRSGDVSEAADLKRMGEALERASRQQVKLIDDLLDVSRIVAGKMALDVGAVELGAVVRAALDMASPLVQQKSLALKVLLDPAIPPIWADRVRVQQVVSNLLNNAIKFTPRGGQVTVLVDTVPGFARLRVIDTGIGIEPGFLPHVFTRFSQRDTSITRTYGGLGLGLALVHHLVELQGGTVRAESAGTGQGSTFTVTLPLARATDQADDERRALQVTQPLDRPGRNKHYDALSGLRVLFIDDDLRTREAVLEVLQLTGAEVALAESAAEGATAVEAFKPQVILCDIAMPGEDGYTFIRKLRARESGKPIPALALTAMATDEDRRRALAAGFQLHMAKPIDIDRLREAVLELATMAGADRA